MDLSSPPTIPTRGSAGGPQPAPVPEADLDASLLQHWDLLCGAVLERLAALAADAPDPATEAARWAAVRDGLSALQTLRAVAERAMARRPVAHDQRCLDGCRVPRAR